MSQTQGVRHAQRLRSDNRASVDGDEGTLVCPEGDRDLTQRRRGIDVVAQCAVAVAADRDAGNATGFAGGVGPDSSRETVHVAVDDPSSQRRQCAWRQAVGLGAVRLTCCRTGQSLLIAAERPAARHRIIASDRQPATQFSEPHQIAVPGPAVLELRRAPLRHPLRIAKRLKDCCRHGITEPRQRSLDTLDELPLKGNERVRHCLSSRANRSQGHTGEHKGVVGETLREDHVIGRTQPAVGNRRKQIRSRSHLDIGELLGKLEVGALHLLELLDEFADLRR